MTGPRVGPVLQAGPRGEAVISAIRAENEDVEVLDRGGYLRVLVPSVCRVTRRAIEEHVGGGFELPSDLERIMPSFQGRLHVDPTHAIWWAAGQRPP